MPHYSLPVGRFVCLAADFCFTTVFMIAPAVAALFFAACSLFEDIAEAAFATGVFREGDFSAPAFLRLRLFGSNFTVFDDVAGLTGLAFGAGFLAAFFCLIDFSILTAGSTTF